MFSIVGLYLFNKVGYGWKPSYRFHRRLKCTAKCTAFWVHLAL